MSATNGGEFLISQAGSCHNGEVGTIVTPLRGGAMVRVGECVHWFNDTNLRPVPEQDTIPEPAVSGE